MTDAPLEHRVLLLCGSQAAVMARGLRRAGIACAPCFGLSDLLAELRRGAAALLIDEARLRPVPPALAAWFAAQPPWSDLPVLLVRGAGGRQAARDPAPSLLQALPRITVLQSPVAAQELCAACRNALRSRRRQYAARAAMLRLRAEGARADFALQAAGLGAFRLRLDDFILETSPRCRDILGHAGRETLRYQDLVASVPQSERQALWNTVQTALQNRTPFSLQYRAERADGGRPWLQLDGQAFFDDDGTAREVTGTVTDISARRRAELDLRASETAFRRIFEQAAVGIAEVGLDGTWRRVNDRLCAILGRSRVALLATNFQTLTHPDDLEADLSELQRLLAGEIASYTMEKRYLTPSGEVVWAKLGVELVRDEHGAPSHCVSVVEDITARRSAEAQLRRLTETLEAEVAREVAAREAAQAQLAQSAKLEALGQLAGGIAHDFNNVLQAVTGGLALIGKRADDPAMVQRLARMSADAASRGASVTGRLLSFARRGKLHGAPVPVTDLLEGMAEMLAHTLGSKYAVTVAAEPGLWLFADRGQLETVLVNLVLNARDALPDGGEIRLEAAAEPPGAMPLPGLASSDFVRLRVADHGAGMTAAALARAAEPFFTTKPAGQGTGLGLAMARGFAQQSGGGLAIESTPARGTTVSLWFPRCQAAPAEEAPSAAEPAVVPGQRLLVVDDDAIVREVLVAVLAAAGYDVEQASDGLAALAHIESGAKLHGLVTDLTMPGMSGDTLIAEARQRRPGLPVLLLTGYAERRLRETRRPTSPGIAVLTKPVTAPLLLATLRALLAPSPARPPRAAAEAPA